MKLTYNIEKKAAACVAFGTFEFMHKGHFEIIKKLKTEAENRKMESIIVSICNKNSEEIFSTEEEKIFHLRNEEVDEFITYECEEEMDRITFMKNVIIDQLHAKTVVIGKDDDFEKLSQLAVENNVKVIGCELVKEDGVTISRENIKKLFETCEFEKLRKMCGHPYIMIGVVEHGKALGRTVGMPTANLGMKESKRKPPNGVYATRTYIDEEIFKGLTNIGKRPSVDNDDRITIETHLLDFSRNIYGRTIVTEVYLFIRGVVKFNNLQEVQNQVKLDIEKTRSFLESLE